MKFGADNSKKTIAAVVLFLVALFLFIRMISGSSNAHNATPTATTPPPTPARQAHTGAHRGPHGKADKTSGPVTPSLDPRLRLDDLKLTENTVYDGTGRNIFVATEEIQIPKAQGNGLLTQNHTPEPPPPPPQTQVHTPPPINLKFFGFASGPDHKRVFLSQGDDVFVAAEGEIVQRRYKIVKINNNNIEVLDVLSNNRQTIPLTAG